MKYYYRTKLFGGDKFKEVTRNCLQAIINNNNKKDWGLVLVKTEKDALYFEFTDFNKKVSKTP